MKTGLLLDNLDSPADSSFAKLRAMQAGVVGLLWTGGTRHRRAVYERCERELARPLYILRIGGHRQTPAEWLADARAALAEVPEAVLLEDRLVIAAGNEPNIEFSENGADYGRFYASLHADQSSVPILFACPSLGLDGWSRYLAAALAEAGKPRWGIVNLYAGNVGRVADFAGVFQELYIGEVNSAPDVRGDARYAFLREALGRFQANRVKAALVFIAGGRSYGAWDEGYIVSGDEARGLGDIRMEEKTMPTLMDTYPNIYEEWKRAGGVESNFRDHLLGIGVLQPTTDDIPHLAEQMKAKADQIIKVAAALPKA